MGRIERMRELTTASISSNDHLSFWSPFSELLSSGFDGDTLSLSLSLPSGDASHSMLFAILSQTLLTFFDEFHSFSLYGKHEYQMKNWRKSITNICQLQKVWGSKFSTIDLLNLMKNETVWSCRYIFIWPILLCKAAEVAITIIMLIIAFLLLLFDRNFLVHVIATRISTIEGEKHLSVRTLFKKRFSIVLLVQFSETDST